MADVVDLRPILALRPQIQGMTTIILADTVHDVFAEYCEYPDDEAFTDVLLAASDELARDLADAEELKERYWWACARRYAINNAIDLIDAEFCRTFDPYRHHVPTLQWARKYLDTLPSRYHAFLKGAGNDR